MSLDGFPAPLAAKAREIERACPGFKVISAYRPGARIAGTSRMSLHAVRRAVDMAGPNPGCAYGLLADWPGGVSTDYAKMRHLHFSYQPNGQEWGVRFAHGGFKRWRRHARR